MKIVADVEEDEFDGDYATVSGLRITCPRCGHEVRVFGAEESSAKRGGVMLREECPRNELNFYIVEQP